MGDSAQLRSPVLWPNISSVMGHLSSQLGNVAHYDAHGSSFLYSSFCYVGKVLFTLISIPYAQLCLFEVSVQVLNNF